MSSSLCLVQCWDPFWSTRLQTPQLRLLTSVFAPLFLFCLRFVSQFEGKNTITRADLHFRSDKEIKLVLWPHYHRISWLFIAIFMPRSPPSSSWCRQMWQPFVANVANCCKWPWLKINKLLFFFPLKREKGRWRGNTEKRIDGQLERCVASLVISVTQQCPTGLRHNYSSSYWMLCLNYPPPNANYYCQNTLVSHFPLSFCFQQTYTPPSPL